MKIRNGIPSFATLTTLCVVLALPGTAAKAADDCEIRYFYTASQAKNESGRWATISGNAGQSMPIRGRLYIMEIQNLGKHDVDVFLEKQRKSVYLRSGETGDSRRLGSAAVLSKVQCLETIAGRPQTPPTEESSAEQAQRSDTRPTTPSPRQGNAGTQKEAPTAGGDREPVRRRPPPLQANDPDLERYNDGLADRSRPQPGVPSRGRPERSQPPGDSVTAKAFDYFECGLSNHRPVNAYLLAMASHAIYPVASSGADNEDGNWNQFVSRFVNQFKDLGMDTVQLIDGGASGVEVAVMSNQGCIFVVYRGSQSPTSANLSGIKDWLVDFNVTPFPPPIPVDSQALPPVWWAPGVIVSNGSYLALQGVYSSVRDAIHDQQAEAHDRKLFIAGHSLGGGLAVLTAYQLQRADSIGTQGVYTFGGPKVGGILFRNDYGAVGISERTHRWTFDLDPAAHMPPSPADQSAMIEIGIKLGLPDYLAFPPVPSTFRHVGNRLRPPGAFGAECVHSITVYGEGIRQTLTNSQRALIPTAWLQNSSFQIGDCQL